MIEDEIAKVIAEMEAAIVALEPALSMDDSARAYQRGARDAYRLVLPVLKDLLSTKADYRTEQSDAGKPVAEPAGGPPLNSP